MLTKEEYKYYKINISNINLFYFINFENNEKILFF
jgi:hypothetical protein